MTTSNAIKAIESMLRIQLKKNNKSAKKRKDSHLHHLIGSYLSVQI